MIKELVLGGVIATSGILGGVVDISEMSYEKGVFSEQHMESKVITKHYTLTTNSSSTKEPFYMKKGQKLTIEKSGDTAVYYTLYNKYGERVGQYSSSIIYYAKEEGNVYVQYHVPFVYDDMVEFTVSYTIQ